MTNSDNHLRRSEGVGQPESLICQRTLSLSHCPSDLSQPCFPRSEGVREGVGQDSLSQSPISAGQRLVPLSHIRAETGGTTTHPVSLPSYSGPLVEAITAAFPGSRRATTVELDELELHRQAEFVEQWNDWQRVLADEDDS